MSSRIYTLIALSILLSIAACRKNSFVIDSGAELAFSTDTLTFDTVFTALGSATRGFKIYNPHNKSIVSTVFLENSASSQFRINVDGVPGGIAQEIKLLPNDSMWIFAEVTVDPNNIATPFVVTDNIRFRTNGNEQLIALVAWGQNANYFNADTLSNCDEVWTADKPYVIFNYLMVDTLCKLTIEKGAQIYFHSGASLFIRGTLHVNGEKDDEVVFQHDRLESFFDDLPGQWGAIHLLRGSGTDTNQINYAIIKNSLLGIANGTFIIPEVGNISLGPMLTPSIISNTVIQNVQTTGLYGFFGNIVAINLLIYNSGQHNVWLNSGGIYQFFNCTFANYGSSFLDHKEPALVMDNTAISGTSIDLIARFTNTLVYGGIEKELLLVDVGNSEFDFIFDHCIIKTDKDVSDTSFYKNVLKNNDPRFVDISDGDYHLESNSPAINTGINFFAEMIDLDGESRDSIHDIGAYEYK